MTDPEYVRSLILHRCPEIGPADLAVFAQSEADTLPLAITAEVLEVLDQIEARLAALEVACGQIAEPAGL
jgi:hypothetical protein